MLERLSHRKSQLHRKSHLVPFVILNESLFKEPPVFSRSGHSVLWFVH